MALLNEGHKLEVYDTKLRLTIAAYPHMEKDSQEEISASLQLPDDLLNDILEEDTTVDDINILKDALHGN